MAFVRSCWKLHLCPIEPMSAGSKTDPLLAKAEPISDGEQDRGVRLWERNSPADTKVSEEVGGGGAPDAGAKIPLAAQREDHGEAGCPRAAHGEDHGEADSHLQPMEDPTPEHMDAWRRRCSCGKPTLEQAPGKTCGPMERGAHAGAGLLTVHNTLSKIVWKCLHPPLWMWSVVLFSWLNSVTTSNFTVFQKTYYQLSEPNRTVSAWTETEVLRINPKIHYSNGKHFLTA